MKVHWPYAVAFGIVVTAFLFQSARVWLLEKRNAAEQDELRKLRKAFRSRFRVIDSGPRVTADAAYAADARTKEHKWQADQIRKVVANPWRTP